MGKWGPIQNTEEKKFYRKLVVSFSVPNCVSYSTKQNKTQKTLLFIEFSVHFVSFFLFLSLCSRTAGSYLEELPQLFTAASAECSEIDQFSSDTLSRGVGHAYSKISRCLERTIFLVFTKQHPNTTHKRTQQHSHTHRNTW